MPFKDREEKLAYQRAWYAKNREKVIAKVAERKRTLYAGVCRNCGGPTMGSTKNKIPEWCSKPACRAAQRDPWLQLLREGRHVTHWKHALTTMKSRKVWKGVCTCGWQSKRHADIEKVEAEYKTHTNLVERELKHPRADR